MEDCVLMQAVVRTNNNKKVKYPVIYMHDGQNLFDEATSAVDVETEGYIQQHLEEITQNTTTVLIAHRLSTVRNCDKIIVMDKGEIVEEGKHEALLNLNGVYAKLWQIQTGNYTQNF